MQLFKYKTERQKMADREEPLSRYIPISHLKTPTVFQTKNGALGSVISLAGYPFDVRDLEDLNWVRNIVATFLQNLSDEFAVYVTTFRKKHNVYPEGNFKEGFARDFNEAYLGTFKNRSLYINEYYLTVMMKGGTTKAAKGLDILTRFSHKATKAHLEAFDAKNLKKLQQAVRMIMTSFSDFCPKLLGANDESAPKTNKKSELLSFFSILINGQKRTYLYPTQDCATLLPARRLFFGHDTLEWQGNTPEDKTVAALLSIKRYSTETVSVMLDPLLTVDFETISTHTFLRQDNAVSMDAMKTQLKHLSDAPDESVSDQQAILGAMDNLASQRISFGLHHNTILVMGQNMEALEEHIALISKIYSEADCLVVRETLNLESAFWGQLPGNASYIKRQALLSSENFADFCSFHNYHHGYLNHNHLGSAVTLVETKSRTPLYINFHEKGSGKKNDLSKGHSTIIAPSNAGKTTLMLALDCQAQKYNGRSVFFDRDCGCEIYVRAMGGFYTAIDPNRSTGFNPLQLADTPENRDFLIKWLASLLMEKGEALKDLELKLVEEVIHRSYTLPKEMRNLSVIASFFPVNFERLPSLHPWLKSQDPNRPDGRLAYLFDNTEDQLNLNFDISGFDMTHLLDREPQNVITSVMFYLFHRLEALMDGHLMGIYLDEGWQLLENPYWAAQMRKYLVTLRKKNVYLVFATQSPGTVAKSSLRESLIEGSATNIFLPNPKADPEDYMKGFKLTHREYDFLRNTDPRTRQFLVKQNDLAAIGKLNLEGLEDYIAVFSGNKTTVTLLDEIRSEVGDDPKVWLPIFQQRRPK